MGRFGDRGELPADFKPGECSTTILSAASNKTYKPWILLRHVTSERTPSLSNFDFSQIPSYASVRSLLTPNIPTVTSIAFTPILPYPATEYDTINTTMKNFQDVLLQKGLQYGPLWSDEGVYRIAEYLKLLNPVKFNNIFLGNRWISPGKVIINCCGQYLRESGISSVLVENEIYGPGVVNSVMEGGNYMREERYVYHCRSC